MNAVQIGLVGVAGALLAIQFKNGKSEYGIYLSVAVSIFIFLNIVGRLEIILETLRAIGDMIMIDRAYIGTLLKMVGITYAAEFSSGICKDAGYQTVASQIEIFSKLTILALGMPILLALLETIHAFFNVVKMGSWEKAHERAETGMGQKKSMVDKNSVCAAVVFFVDSACRGIGDRRRAGA